MQENATNNEYYVTPRGRTTQVVSGYDAEDAACEYARMNLGIGKKAVVKVNGRGYGTVLCYEVELLGENDAVAENTNAEAW